MGQIEYILLFSLFILAETPKISAIDVESLEEIEMERKIKLKLLKDEGSSKFMCILYM